MNGKDIVEGGSGADIFNFYKGSDLDTVVDFHPGTDAIQLTLLGLTDFGDVKPLMDQKGADVEIDFGSGDRLILLDTKISELSAGDFLFVN